MKNSSPATALYSRIREILESARTNVARSVNTTQVVSNWLVGREIVEEEQRGQKRAAYGKRLLADLSTRLQADCGRGFSIKNLEHFRDFYLTYTGLLGFQIPHAARTESSKDAGNAVSIPHALRAEFTFAPDTKKSHAARRILSVAGSLHSDDPQVFRADRPQGRQANASRLGPTSTLCELLRSGASYRRGTTRRWA